MAMLPLALGSHDRSVDVGLFGAARLVALVARLHDGIGLVVEAANLFEGVALQDYKCDREQDHGREDADNDPR